VQRKIGNILHKERKVFATFVPNFALFAV